MTKSTEGAMTDTEKLARDLMPLLPPQSSTPFNMNAYALQIATHVQTLLDKAEKSQREKCADELEALGIEEEYGNHVLKEKIHSWRTSR